MDKYNTFHPKPFYQLLRIDYLSMLLLLSAATLFHYQEVVWWKFIAAFAWIDLLGTLPGWYVYYVRRRDRNRTIPAIFHHLYNFSHSLATNAVLICVWYVLEGGWDWAMLAGPIHILGDRSLYGNIYKPAKLSFEPEPHDAYDHFLTAFQASERAVRRELL